MQGQLWDTAWEYGGVWERTIARCDTTGVPLEVGMPSRMRLRAQRDHSDVLLFDGELIPHPDAPASSKAPGHGTHAVRFRRDPEQIAAVPPGWYEHDIVLTYPGIGPHVIRGWVLVRDRVTGR